ncbi:MAG: ABC transporter permease, partial [Clostridia bacterium]|nr:ABC transporter permease [Clostridia bacterium]
WLVLGVSLLLAVCIGISGAMESVLAGKIEEIGMLRAVGATRRQIRRIFGREAWILVLFSLPTGIPAGMAAIWIISRLLPEQIAFRADVQPAFAVAALSALCVFLSSRLPLRRASAQAPMGVLRDTGMLRRAKKLRSRKAFRPTVLIAGRQMRFHPLRQAGAAAMAALMLLCTVLLAEELLRDPYEKQYDFEIRPINSSWEMRSLCTFAAAERYRDVLSEQDIAKIRAIPEVKSAVLETKTIVNMVLPGDTVPGYFREVSFESTDPNGVVYKTAFNVACWPVSSLEYLLWDAEDRVHDFNDYLYTVNETTYREMLGAARVFGTEGKLVSLPLAVVDPESETLRQAVAQGRIDRRALDAGEEVLVYAPKLYIHMSNYGHYYSSVAELSYWEKSRNYKEVTSIENDYFRPGMTLDLVQAICGADESRIDYHAPQSVEHYEEYYRKTQVQPACVSVGAVLEGEGLTSLVYDMCLVTTEEGLKSLGFEMTEPTFIRITLRGSVDEAAEKRLEEQLGNIAARADMEVYNFIEAAREARRSREQTVLTWACVLSVFFAVTVAMQVGNAGRRIRADSRMIGTLRAVGADEKALLGCYRLPAIGAVLAGFLIAAGLYLMVYIWGDIYVYGYPLPVILCMAFLGVLCLLCCLLGVQLQLRQTLRKSVVENIREL